MMWYVKTIFIVAALSLIGCSYPEKGERTGGPPPSESEEVSVSFLKSLYAGHPVNIRKNYVIRGHVVSSDRYGNYYKTVVVEDAGAGIEIKIDREDIFKDFAPGHEVTVHCNSLTLGGYSGMVQLGSAPAGSYETGYIDANSIASHLRRTGEAPEKLMPEHVTLAGVAGSLLSRYVRVCGVQFVEEEAGKLWCEQDVDTDRCLTDPSGRTLTVRTSYRAAFAYWPLPGGSGYIEGILSYFNGNFQLRVVDPRNVVMTGERF